MTHQPPADPPDDWEVRFALGLRQLRGGQNEAAAITLRSLAETDPDRADLLAFLGWAEMALLQWNVAESRHPAALRHLGILLANRERHAEALALAETALGVDPNHSEALLMHGNALIGLDRPGEALRSFEQAAQLGDATYEALTKLGLTYAALGQPKAALQSFDQAIAERPREPLGLYRRGLTRLQLRDFAGGWDDHEARLDLPTFVASSMASYRPFLHRVERAAAAEGLAGRDVMLLGEQAIGDQVMFASMIPDLARTAAKVTCVCDNRLARLFSASFEDVTFLGQKHPVLVLGADEALLAMGSLGRLYRRSEADFPGVPYLRPRPAVRATWAERLGPRPKGLRIGLSWRGGAPGTGRSQRSVALAQLEPVLDLPDCEFVSLQYGEVSAEIAAFNADRRNPIRVFPPGEIEDFEDLAGLVANLDAVVSVQTALVHLTGALGQTCLALLPHRAEWRYMQSGASMPWYRSVHLFRQAEPGAWEAVIADAAATLRRQT